MTASYLCLANIRHDGLIHRAGSVFEAEPRAVEGLLRLRAVTPHAPTEVDGLASESQNPASAAEAQNQAQTKGVDGSEVASEAGSEKKPASRRKAEG